MAAASSFSAGLLTAASFLLVLIALPAPAECGRGEEYNVLEKETPQKNYTKEEEGKVAPYR